MKAKIAILLMFTFMQLIVTPTIISVVEKNFDISILFNISEEENNQKEISKKIDLKLSNQKNHLSLLNILDKTTLYNYHLKRYTNISQEINSPPPELF